MPPTPDAERDTRQRSFASTTHPTVDRELYVLSDKVSVDRDRGRGPRTGRRDHLRARIDDITRDPDAEGTRPATSIACNEAGVEEFAAKTRQQAVSVGGVSGSNEDHGPCDHLTIHEFDPGQPVSFDDDRGNFTAHNPNPARLEANPLASQQAVDVAEEDDVVRPLAHELGVVHSTWVGPEDPDGLVAHLPAVTVRAVQQIPPPPLANTGDGREVVEHSGRNQDATRAERATASQTQNEPSLNRYDLPIEQLNAIAGHLSASDGQKLHRRHPITRQESLHVCSGGVAWGAGVDHDDLPTRTTQYERGTQAGRSAADDRNVVDPSVHRGHLDCFVRLPYVTDTAPPRRVVANGPRAERRRVAAGTRRHVLAVLAFLQS